VPTYPGTVVLLSWMLLSLMGETFKNSVGGERGVSTRERYSSGIVANIVGEYVHQIELHVVRVFLSMTQPSIRLRLQNEIKTWSERLGLLIASITRSFSQAGYFEVAVCGN